MNSTIEQWFIIQTIRNQISFQPLRFAQQGNITTPHTKNMARNQVHITSNELIIILNIASCK